MPISRYRNNSVVINDDDRYEDIFSKRGVSEIFLTSFEKIKKLRYKELNGVTLERYTWSSSDRFYKLSEKYYGDSVYWWIIAFFNRTPLETDVKIGQTIIIPTPLERIIEIMEI